VKVRSFVSLELDDDESAMFASLLAPGVAQAYIEVEKGEKEVVLFGASAPGRPDGARGLEVQWRPSALAESLSQALREGGVRVVGLRP